MSIKKFLMIPGPTPIPEEVKQAMAADMINHRSSAFKEILNDCVDGVKWAYQTKNDLLIIPSSGSGGMEAAVANIMSPGEKAVVANIGNFGNRFVKILKAYGISVVDVKFDWGKSVDLNVLEENLKNNPDAKAVFWQQNETSTGVLNDVAAIKKVVDKYNMLSVVDAVSGLLTAPMPVDDLGLDVVVSGSQKAFMIPPGLAFISVSKRAWEKIEVSKCPRFYFDLRWYREMLANGETPTTPAISIFFALRAALKLLKAEGLDKIFARHLKITQAVRAGAKALGMKMLASDKDASRAVTAIVPDSDPEAFRKLAREKYGVTLAGGQGQFKGKIFRIGHLGYVEYSDIVTTFSALELALQDVGQKIELGSSLTAIQKELVKK